MHEDQLSRIGSGTVVALGSMGTAIALLALGRTAGWDPVWRTFGVTPLQPPFFDMHVVIDYAACSWRGIDAYAPHACNVANFNYPPVWLWAGFLGIDASAAPWLSTTITAASAVVMLLLLRGRSWDLGVMAVSAIISPSVLMGVERGNVDLLILALVGSAALTYQEKNILRLCGAVAFLGLGVVLKLFPMFCVALVARFSRQTLIFACTIVALALVYLSVSMETILLIRRNVPTTFILSYGYKSIFLGVDHIWGEAGLGPTGLTDTFVPASTAAIVLICSIAVAAHCSRNRRKVCSVDTSVAGTAFLFGAGIYCGTYLLGTNFVYRLMFLLLCIPQLMDWQHRKVDTTGVAESGLFAAVLAVLWLNGNANGHSIFLFLPQLLNWFLFFFLASVLMLNFLRTSADWPFANRASRS